MGTHEMILSVKSKYVVTFSREQGTDEFDVKRFVEEAHQRAPWISRHPNPHWYKNSNDPDAFDMTPPNKLLISEVSVVLGLERATATIITHPKYYITMEMMHAYHNYARRVGCAVREQPYIEHVRLAITYVMDETSL